MNLIEKIWEYFFGPSVKEGCEYCRYHCHCAEVLKRSKDE